MFVLTYRYASKRFESFASIDCLLACWLHGAHTQKVATPSARGPALRVDWKKRWFHNCVAPSRCWCTCIKPACLQSTHYDWMDIIYVLWMVGCMYSSLCHSQPVVSRTSSFIHSFYTHPHYDTATWKKVFCQDHHEFILVALCKCLS